VFGARTTIPPKSKIGFSFERADLLHQRGIPGFTQALLLRKSRGGQRLKTARPPPAWAAQRETVQALRFVGQHKVEARNLGVAVHELDLFLQRQALQQIGNACVVA
jgi:hypothetical protein